MALHQDFRDLLEAFAANNVQYLIIGGYAVACHGYPRFTHDLDLLIGTDTENIKHVKRSLIEFGAPDTIIESLETAHDDEIVFLGTPPIRIEIFKKIPGVDFPRAFEARLVAEWDKVQVSVIGLQDLISAKRSTGRPHDLLDIVALEKLHFPAKG